MWREQMEAHGYRIRWQIGVLGLNPTQTITVEHKLRSRLRALHLLTTLNEAGLF